MALEYDIIENKRLVIAKGSGTLSRHEIVNHFDTLSKDPRYKAPMKKLVDFRNVDRFTLSMDDEKKLSAHKSSYEGIFRNERCAIVSSKDIIYGMSRVHEALMFESKIDINVFRDIHEAIKWIDIKLTESEISSSFK